MRISLRTIKKVFADISWNTAERIYFGCLVKKPNFVAKPSCHKNLSIRSNSASLQIAKKNAFLIVPIFSDFEFKYGNIPIIPSDFSADLESFTILKPKLAPPHIKPFETKFQHFSVDIVRISFKRYCL